MIIRVICMEYPRARPDFDEVLAPFSRSPTVFGFIFVPGQGSTAFARATRSKTLCDFQLRLRETFLYTCGAIDLWEWELRLLDREPGNDGDEVPVCLGGRGAPPKYCGGPTGYRLMLKRQKQGEAMRIPVQMEAMIGMFSATRPDEPSPVLADAAPTLDDGFQRGSRRLQNTDSTEPERFSLQEAIRTCGLPPQLVRISLSLDANGLLICHTPNRSSWT